MSVNNNACYRRKESLIVGEHFITNVWTGVIIVPENIEIGERKILARLINNSLPTRYLVYSRLNLAS